MAMNLGRLFAAMTDLPKPKSGLPEYLNSASRLISSSTQRFQIKQENPEESAEQTSKEKEKIHTENKAQSDRAAENDDDDEEDVDAYMNKTTGEIGGPRGPEPTRYGDWERGGRCSDF